MSDETALLKAIRTSPDDDLPRLVYADWLEEQNKSDLANFIRTQIALFRHPPVRRLIERNWVRACAGSGNALTVFYSPTDRQAETLKLNVFVAALGSDPTELINTEVDWRAGSLWSGSGIIRGLTINPSEEDNPNSTASVTVTPTPYGPHHFESRELYRTLTKEESRLWDLPEVRGYYNQILPVFGSSQVVIAPWPEAHLPQHYTVGRVVRGMVEEIRIPVDHWLTAVPEKCQSFHSYRMVSGVGGGYEQCIRCPPYGKVMLDQYPITTVIPADKTPYNLYHDRDNRRGEVHWYDSGRGAGFLHPESDLAGQVYFALTGGEPSGTGFRVYKNTQDAYADVSRALIRLARTTSHVTS